MDWVTDKRFLIGVAIGFLVLPRVAKTVQGAMSKGKSAPAS